MGNLGEPNSSLPWWAEDHVKDKRLEFRREVRQAVDGLLRQSRAHLDVAQQRAFNGVVEADIPAQLAHLADVVRMTPVSSRSRSRMG